jgi:hypothetical protein
MAQAALKTVGFKEFDAMLKPRSFEARLKKQVKKSMELIGLVAADAITSGIDARQPPPGMDSPGEYPNRPRTIAMKKNNTPLVGEAPASLRASIDHEVVRWDEVIVGVLRRRTERGGDGKPDDVINIAAIVHEGATIAVTPKMRVYMASIGFPIDPSTTKIRIPGRPFLRSALKRDLMEEYKKIWGDATQAALAGRG